MIEQQPNQDSSFNVQVPRASTPVALVLEPALRSLLLWYLEAVVAQQNAVNSTLSAQVQHLKRIVQPQQAQIEALQTLVLRITQDQQ
ncbi:MAG: hypothetical protein RMM31_00435, partial [Anaerolineae bacterium]|nr:hypothetical protein [Anaerolineae bacterium]